MATKVTTHDDHEHTVRTIKEEVLGIKFDTTTDDTIGGAFGWEEEKFGKFFDRFRAFYKFQEAAQELDEELPHMTKVSGLADFLKSPSFKKLGIKVTTPNDYVVVGYIFSGVMILHDQERTGNSLGSINSLGELVDKLKKLRKEME